MPIRVAIVEDDPEIRKLTAGILNLCSDLECVGSFGMAEQFLSVFAGLHPDVVLMDIGLPGMSGIACVENCKALAPEADLLACATEFIMFTNHSDSREVFEALKAGANGYVLKNGRPEELAEAVRDVIKGGSPMSRQISRMVTTYFRDVDQLLADNEIPAESDTPDASICYCQIAQLTERERGVLDLLSEGLMYKEIAAQHFVSTHTVRTQVRSIYRKLQVRSRTAALNKCCKLRAGKK